MGICGSSSSEEYKQSQARSKELEKINKTAWTQEATKIKLLLLGAGESGKSTIFKQMKILYGENFSESERSQNTIVVFSNILANFRSVVEAGVSGKVDKAEDESLIAQFKEIPEAEETPLTPAIVTVLKNLWKDPGIKRAWERRAEFQVQDSLAWYMKEIDRIGAPNYVPSVDDILRARVRTSGIVEETYNIDMIQFVMYDVGGQRNERKKWIHCFDKVTAVIFVAAFNEYDQVLYEDNSMGRMDEAVLLFDEICNSKFFKQTSMILFLNKKDLFREKILRVPIRVESGPNQRYLDFEGPYVKLAASEKDSPGFEEAYEAGKEFFLDIFLRRNMQVKKEVYNHVTCATDTDNVKIVFNSCKDIILKDNLRGSGFME